MPWDPNNKGTGIYLSDNNLTLERAFHPSAFDSESVTGTAGYASPAKRYFEIQIVSGSTRYGGLGIADDTYKPVSGKIGENVAEQSSAGLVNGSSVQPPPDGLSTLRWIAPGPSIGSRVTALTGAGTGDLLQIAVDGDRFWAGKNDEWDGDPFTGSGGELHGIPGTIYPLYQASYLDMIGTAKFQPPFTGILPTGYVGWEQPRILKTPGLHFDYVISSTSDSPITSTLYHARLTGEGNGEPDIILPISSFSLTLQADSEDSLTAIVPDGQRYAGELANRGSGQLIIEQFTRHADGSYANFRQVGWAEWNSLKLDYGVSSQSITLQGRKDVPYRSPRTFTPQGVSFRSNTNGIRRLTARLDPDVKPGDTVDYANEEWIIGSVSMSANPSQGDQMELAED